MDNFLETTVTSKKSFLGHVFSANDEEKAEVLNVIQYGLMGVIPVVILNKCIQRFIPEADADKSNLELLVEIMIQLIVIFCGIIVIHRIITYFPTYSGFKYENLTLTNIILAFLVIVLSIQTKLGLKVNIMVENLMDLWNGTSSKVETTKKTLRVAQSMHSPMHSPSQADYLDSSSMQQGMFPPAPTSSHVDKGYSMPMQSKPQVQPMMDMGPMPANSFGGGFGTF